MRLMNFAFLEPVTEFCLKSMAVPNVTPIPAELDDSWKSFERELGGFKGQYAKARAAVTILHSRLASKQSDINAIEIVNKVVKSDALKSMIAKVVEEYEVNEGIDQLTKDYAEALGRAEAMKKVLMETNSERYARFACFVCMESLVDTLLVPCNHVICERCWVRTRSEKCPGCRQQVNDVRKMYTLS